MAAQGYTDDPTIGDDVLLLRRIPSNPPLWVVWDDNEQQWRPSSAAFQDQEGSSVSIVLACELERTGRPLTDALASHAEGFALAAITAGCARENGQIVIRDPTADEPAHGLIVGKKTRAVRKRLAKATVWIVLPNLPDQP